MHYIGDGDSKTFKAISDMKPYGNEFIVKKKECVGHVEKRMGSRLRNIKKEKKLGGKGKLTNVMIKKLTKYYGLAIRQNCDKSIKDMKNAIMATYDHLTSTDKEPKHTNCPSGPSSWCHYRNAELQKNVKNYRHPEGLHKDVAKHILPIYHELSKNELLERCLGGHTQNSNESFNGSLWRMAPKHLHCGTKAVEIATYMSAAIYNEGFSPILTMMKSLGIDIGPNCKKYAKKKDESRIKRQEVRAHERTKEARYKRKIAQTKKNEVDIEEEEILYGPGIAD